MFLHGSLLLLVIVVAVVVRCIKIRKTFNSLAIEKYHHIHVKY